MTKTQKYILYVSAVLVVVLGGYVLTHKPTVKQTVVQSYGATGDTYASQPMVSIGFNVATVTPASLYNGSGRDRVIARVFLTANTPNTYGTTTIYNILVATSTNPYNFLSTSGVQNTNYVFNFTGAVSSPAAGTGGDYNNASTTFGGGSGVGNSLMRWPNGTYLNFMVGSSTNVTAAVNYVFTNGVGGAVNNNSALGSTTSGFAGVEYYPQ